MMRQRAQERKNEEMEIMEVEEERKSGAESESESEYEEYTDSEDEAEPRLKPVFIRKWVSQTEINLKATVHTKMNLVHLFQFCMIFFLLLNTKEDILKIDDVWQSSCW